MPDPDGPDIDEREFITPAKDSEGHSQQMWVRVNPELSRHISVILHSGWFPYRSTGDVIRHALMRHIRWVESLVPIPSAFGRLMAVARILEEEEFNTAFEDSMGKLTEMVSKYIGAGQVGRAKALLGQVMNEVKQMPEDEWKEAAVKGIMDRFRGLLEGTPASLISVEEDGDARKD